MRLIAPIFGYQQRCSSDATAQLHAPLYLSRNQRQKSSPVLCLTHRQLPQEFRLSLHQVLYCLKGFLWPTHNTGKEKHQGYLPDRQVLLFRLDNDRLFQQSAEKGPEREPRNLAVMHTPELSHEQAQRPIPEIDVLF